MSIADLIRETIIGLCKENGPYNGQVEIDGIICISGPKEGQQLVIKVHECLDGLMQENVEKWINDKSIEGIDHTHLSPVKPEPVNSSYLPPVISDLDHDDTSIIQECHSSHEQVPSRASSELIAVKPLSSDGSSITESIENNAIHYPDEKDFRSPKGCFSPILECKLCLKTFDNQDLLEIHNESSHNLFTCRSCLKTFTSRSNLERHSRLHTGQKPYYCVICNKAFSRKDHLSNHMTKHAFKCNTCSKKFNDSLSLASHFTYGHGLTLTNICQLCNKGFSSLAAYQDHLITHPEYEGQDFSWRSYPVTNGLQKFSCHLCPFVSQDAFTFYRHHLAHTFSNQTHFTCFFCDKTFNNLKSFMEHSIEHQNLIASQSLHINWLQQFSNHYQSLATSTNSDAYHNSDLSRSRQDLMSSKHENKRDETFNDFNGHDIRKRKAKRKQNYPRLGLPNVGCQEFNIEYVQPESPTMPKKFKRLTVSDPNFNGAVDRTDYLPNPLTPSMTTAPDFIGSLSTNHTENISDTVPINLKVEKPYVGKDGMEHFSGPHRCGVCQGIFDAFDVLDAHCSEEHNRSACMFCSKTFAQRANRDRHLCLHTGKKPYSCSACDEKFSRGDKLKMHRIKMHGAIYPSRSKDIESIVWPLDSISKNQQFLSRASPPLLGHDVPNSSCFNFPIEATSKSADDSEHVDDNNELKSDDDDDDDTQRADLDT